MHFIRRFPEVRKEQHAGPHPCSAIHVLPNATLVARDDGSRDARKELA
jgi:hypothetical protein